MLYASVHDPIVELPSGYNDKNSVAVWNKGGKRRVTYFQIFACNNFISLVLV